MSRRVQVDRRRFVKLGAGAAGGLLLGLHLPGCAPGEGGDPGEALRMNAFVHLAPEGIVTITVQRPEMGQGVRTALPMIVAEELGADWDSVRVEQADLDEELYGPQYAGGSHSVLYSWERLRTAGATAREMLLRAAAGRWGVEPGDCRAANSRVEHLPTGRSAPFGELLAAAAELELPDEVELKDPEEFTLVGTDRSGVDAPAIGTGETLFGSDLRVPGMLFGTIERVPTFGGRVAAVDAAAAEEVSGVRRVVTVDADSVPAFGPNNPRMANGVGVVADDTWSALRGRRALRITWERGPAGRESSAGLRDRCVQRARRPGDHVIRQDGDPEAALGAAATTVEATYEVPLLAHTPMEPPSCVVDVRAESAEAWAPVQNPRYARTAVARVTGLPEESVVVHPIRMGGGFGRRFYGDFVGEAAYLSREAGAPVQVFWTREDDVRHGFYRPPGHHVLRGGVDDRGRLAAWVWHLLNPSRRAALDRDPAPGEEGELRGWELPANFVPNLRYEYTRMDSAVPLGQWRTTEQSANVFVSEGFVDELAAAAGRDPLEFRLELLGEDRPIPMGDDFSWDSGRLRRCLELAAERGDWGSPLPDGVGRGIACSYAHTSFSAQVIEASVDADGRPRVHRVVCATDCGIVVNPNGARHQVEGCVAYGLSAALHQAITVRDGGVEQGNFDDFPALRHDEMPEVEVHFVPSGEHPTGMGEPALAPVAPALANALHDATGVRHRRLPLVAPA